MDPKYNPMFYACSFFQLFPPSGDMHIPYDPGKYRYAIRPSRSETPPSPGQSPIPKVNERDETNTPNCVSTKREIAKRCQLCP